MYTGLIEETGRVVGSEQSAGGCRLRIATEAEELSPDESIGVSGVSLTVSAVSEETFSVDVIPVTAERTTLSTAQAGDPIHFEADLLAKYVERQRASRTEPAAD